jgi:hypothetical protein
MLPVLESNKPLTVFKIVLFPAPLAPIRDTISPWLTQRKRLNGMYAAVIYVNIVNLKQSAFLSLSKVGINDLRVAFYLIRTALSYYLTVV